MKSPEELKRIRRRRDRQRGYVKQAYDKKKAMLEALSKEVEELESEYRALLSLHEPLSFEQKSRTMIPAALVTRQESLFDKYQELTQLKNALYGENAALYAANAQNMKLGGRIQQIIDEHSSTPTQEEELPFEPLFVEEYEHVVRKMKNEVISSLREPGSIATGASVFGWSDRRTIRNKRMKFMLEKTFASRSAHHVFERSWAILNDPTKYVKLYSSPVHPSLRLLQRVNENMNLFSWKVTTAVGKLCSVFLLARLRTEFGYMLLFRTIDEHRSMVTETETWVPIDSHFGCTWVEKSIWMVLSDEQTNDGKPICRLRFGGTTKVVWLIEVLLIAMRWENLVIGPMFNLCSEPST
ncbi:hypothetical protein Poli38472_007088 [Pythium oligandrum]|uniref:BZIP domain-containing protein n=1 Tax=Pythium oligandrum TaxID=41045 RepID=A0A8K1CA41_PYTOL|nr:hypothetical protein Poli38472_007088 [Pythium oligandrum]|eukprot:TMW58943.1 hypothetical protein Poli38472_007088 [Pythium oligandrum]